MILIEKTTDRKKFVTKSLKKFQIKKEVQNLKILLKPNVVSFEEYPTTTHPEVLDTLLKELKPVCKEIIVADGPAPDAGNTTEIIKNHPLNKVCEKYGMELIDIHTKGFIKKKSERGYQLEVSKIPFECDYIISLPVLKVHAICQMTGALKNQYGLLSAREKRLLHYNFFKNIHRGIAELNTIIKPNFFIMDAVQTLVKSQEIRWGGIKKDFGYMLAGKNPVELDMKGFELLSKIYPMKEVKHLEIAKSII